jgi:hypothetical protein
LGYAASGRQAQATERRTYSTPEGEVIVMGEGVTIAVFLVLAWLLGESKGHTTESTPASTGPTPAPAPHPSAGSGDALWVAVKQYASVLWGRTKSGDAWRGDLETALHTISDRNKARGDGEGVGPFAPSMFAAVAEAIARWIGFESGGLITSTTSLSEVGLIQFSPGAITAFDRDMGLSITAKDLGDTSKPRSWHAEIAILQVLWLIQQADASNKQRGGEPVSLPPGIDPASAILFRAKLAHALPGLLNELDQQKVDYPFPTEWREYYHPGATVASYGNISQLGAGWTRPRGLSDDALAFKGVDGLILRFWTNAAVVAWGVMPEGVIP